MKRLSDKNRRHHIKKSKDAVIKRTKRNKLRKLALQHIIKLKELEAANA